MKCWNFMNCEKKTRDACPAYPNNGLDCWKVTGTKCDAGKHEKLSVKEKIAFCRECEFYIKYAHRF